MSVPPRWRRRSPHPATHRHRRVSTSLLSFRSNSTCGALFFSRIPPESSPIEKCVPSAEPSTSGAALLLRPNVMPMSRSAANSRTRNGGRERHQRRQDRTALRTPRPLRTAARNRRLLATDAPSVLDSPANSFVCGPVIAPSVRSSFFELSPLRARAEGLLLVGRDQPASGSTAHAAASRRQRTSDRGSCRPP